VSTQPPTRLASEDVIISAPMSYTGSARRIMRIRHRAEGDGSRVGIAVLAVLLVLVVWVFVTVWYLVWGIWLVGYRVVRRGSRKRRVEAMRHRELLGTIQGSAAASAAAIVAATSARGVSGPAPTATVCPSTERIGDVDRDSAIDELRGHMLAGRLTAVEFEERLGSVHAARTWADLGALRGDLPMSP
jgi:Domain of unknown function (DUF1707)